MGGEEYFSKNQIEALEIKNSVDRVKRVDTTEEKIGKLEDRSKETILNLANGAKKKNIEKSLGDSKARSTIFSIGVQKQLKR